MKNAHERFGWLEFEKQLKDTRTRLRVALDRFISEPAENKEASGTCHLVSVFGNDVDIGAIWAGLAGQCPEAQFIIGNSAGFTSSRLGRKESGMTPGSESTESTHCLCIAVRSRLNCSCVLPLKARAYLPNSQR